MDPADAAVFKGPADKIDLDPIGDDTTFMFTRDPFPEFPDTMIFRDCRLAVFRCNMIDKNKK